MDFFKDLLYNEKGKVSKTKLGMWISVFLGVLQINGIIDAQMFQTLATVAGGIAGVGIRDIFKKN